MEAQVNLLDLSRTRLEQFFLSLGEKPFRARQVMKWIYKRGEYDFSMMTDLSKSLRDKLIKTAVVRLPKILGKQVSADGTRKWIIQVSGGSSVECVYIPEENRGTLCVSSQSGCALACSFCATGKQGFDSNLTVSEIIGQVWIVDRELRLLCSDDDRTKRITNVVMMGMGEPLLNFDHVVDAVNLMMDDYAYGLSKRRVTLSTSGIVPALLRLGEYTNVSLAVSLHAANDELRNQLVPINKKYPIQCLLDSVSHYINTWSDKKRVVTIEYVLLSEVNDQLKHARELAALLVNLPCKINLIPFNPFPGSNYQCPSNMVISRFQQYLQGKRMNTTVRKTRGDDIDAACGQLVGHVKDRTRRSQAWNNLNTSIVGSENVPVLPIKICNEIKAL